MEKNSLGWTTCEFITPLVGVKQLHLPIYFQPFIGASFYHIYKLLQPPEFEHLIRRLDLAPSWYILREPAFIAANHTHFLSMVRSSGLPQCCETGSLEVSSDFLNFVLGLWHIWIYLIDVSHQSITYILAISQIISPTYIFLKQGDFPFSAAFWGPRWCEVAFIWPNHIHFLRPCMSLTPLLLLSPG